MSFHHICASTYVGILESVPPHLCSVSEEQERLLGQTAKKAEVCGFHSRIYECLRGRELLMKNICIASKTEGGLVRVCLLCLSVCSLPALTLFSWETQAYCGFFCPSHPLFLPEFLCSDGPMCILEWVYKGGDWWLQRYSSTHMGIGTLCGATLKRGKCLQHIQWVNHAWLYSRFWTLLLLLAKHKREESKPTVQACHLICKCLKGIHLGAQACIWQADVCQVVWQDPLLEMQKRKC